MMSPCNDGSSCGGGNICGSGGNICGSGGNIFDSGGNICGSGGWGERMGRGWEGAVLIIMTATINIDVCVHSARGGGDSNAMVEVVAMVVVIVVVVPWWW